VKELHEVRQWLASEQFWKNAGTTAGVVGTMGAVLGSILNPEVGILRWIAAGLGIGTAAAQLPDAIIEDRAAQSGRGGAKQVTSLDPDTARGNLVLGWVSLGVAGLDAGLQPEVVAQVVKLPGVVKAAMTMTKTQSQVFMARLAQLKGEVTDAIIEKMTQGVRRGDPEAGAIFPDKENKAQQILRNAKRLKNAKLNASFGELREPAFPGVKDFEQVNGKIVKNPELQVIKPGEQALPLEKGKKYIWAIDKEGHLRIGVETEVSPGERLGHPTLVEDGQARSGGEIKFNSETKEWRINDESGRYSRGRKPDEKAKILDNVHTLFNQAGLNVGVKHSK
jgi:hypothetical protein